MFAWNFFVVVGEFYILAEVIRYILRLHFVCP